MFWHPGYAPLWFHFFTDTVSILIGAWYYAYLYNKSSIKGKSSMQKKIILIGAALGALIGSRLIAALERPDLFFNPPNWLYYYSVKTVAGGIAGGIFGVEFVKFILGIKESTGDIMVGPLALGIIIGRIGCFMVGVRDQTVGLVTSLPWGMDQGDKLLRHPTALYEIIVTALIWFGIEKLKKHNIKKGEFPVGSGLYFRLFCVGYFLFRLLVEFVKPVHPLFAGLTAIQWTGALVVVGYGISLLRMTAKKA